MMNNNQFQEEVAAWIEDCELGCQDALEDLREAILEQFGFVEAELDNAAECFEKLNDRVMEQNAILRILVKRLDHQQDRIRKLEERTEG